MSEESERVRVRKPVAVVWELDRLLWPATRRKEIYAERERREVCRLVLGVRCTVVGESSLWGWHRKRGDVVDWFVEERSRRWALEEERAVEVHAEERVEAEVVEDGEEGRVRRPSGEGVLEVWLERIGGMGEEEARGGTEKEVRVVGKGCDERFGEARGTLLLEVVTVAVVAEGSVTLLRQLLLPPSNGLPTRRQTSGPSQSRWRFCLPTWAPPARTDRPQTSNRLHNSSPSRAPPARVPPHTRLSGQSTRRDWAVVVVEEPQRCDGVPRSRAVAGSCAAASFRACSALLPEMRGDGKASRLLEPPPLRPPVHQLHPLAK